MADRKGFIDSAVLQYGLTTPQVNNALKDAGFEQLNKIESSLIDAGKWGTSAWERAGQGVKDITSGLSTIVSGAASHPIRTAKAVKNYIVNNTLPDMIGDLYDITMKPVQLDSESIGRNYAEGGIKNVLEGVVAGAVTNPTDAALLTAPIWGKGVGATVRGVANNVDKLPIPKWMKNTIRGAASTQGREINQILRDSKLVAAPEVEDLKALNLNLQTAKREDVAQAIRNLETGNWTGTETQMKLTNQLKDMTSKIDEILQRHGFNPDVSRSETINQYAVRYFQNKGKDVPINDIDRLLNDSDLAKKYGTTPEEVQQVLQQGDKLYQEGFIRPVKHSVTAETTREGYVSEAAKKVREPNAKMYGTQSYEDIADGIKAGAYDNLLKTLGKSNAATDAVDQMIGVAGRKLDNVDDVLKLGKDEVVFSPRLLKEKVGTALAGRENINEPLQSITRGLNKAEIEKYADDLYVLKRADLEALQKAFNVAGKAEGLGVFGDIAGVAKTVALATPRYIAGNATTNFLMNPITGTHIGHYTKAIENAMRLSDDVPELLKRTASYQNYLGDYIPLGSGMKTVYTKLLKDLKEGNWATKWQAVNSMVNTPMFGSANAIETLQRTAEYFNQAEKYAREVGKPLQQVLKEAKVNKGLNSTYRAINRRVEEILGDYSGRNYYAPQSFTNIANTMLPFYRPFTQAPRQFWNAVTQYPIGTQIGAVAPSRIGNEWSERGKEIYGVEPYKSQGGYPVLPPFGKSPGRVLYNQYHAFSPVGEMLDNPLDVLSGNPFLGTIYNIGAGRTRYGETPLPPMVYKNYDGSYSVMDNNGNVHPYVPEEHPADRMKFSIAETIKTLTPVNALNAYLLPDIAAMTGQSYTRPADTSILGQVGDLKIPFLMEGGTGRTMQGKQEIYLPQLGFNYANTYPERATEYTPSQVRSTRKRIYKKQTSQERR